MYLAHRCSHSRANARALYFRDSHLLVSFDLNDLPPAEEIHGYTSSPRHEAQNLLGLAHVQRLDALRTHESDDSHCLPETRMVHRPQLGTWTTVTP